MSKAIEVDTRTFVRFWAVVFVIAALGLMIWKALTGLIIVGIAAFLAIAIQPLANRISRLFKKTDATFASVLAYVLIIGIFAIVVAVIGPMVVEQTTQFVQKLPETFENSLGGWDGINDFGHSVGISDLQGQIMTALEKFSTDFVGNLSGYFMSGIGTIAQVITNLVLTLVLTLLFAIEGPTIVDTFWNALSRSQDKPAMKAYQRLASRMAEVVGIYVSKQVTVAILDGLVVTVVVLVLAPICGFSVGLALPLGLTAMVLYLIPMFGPIISCVLITLLLLCSSPVAAVIFLVFYIVYAQIENNAIAPKLQGEAMNLPAAVVLVAIIIGMYAFGFVGAIVAIPVAGCIKVFVEELPNLRKVTGDA